LKLARSFPPVILAAGVLFYGLSAVAQVVDSEQERVRMMAEQIATVMNSLEDRAAGYPKFIEDLQAGLVTIEQADEEVAKLIQQLTDATDKMEDGGEFDASIDAYKDATTALLAQAEASNNDAIKASIPDLEGTLDNLGKSDEARTQTVIEARNLVRSLEQNREAIAFFIKANQVQRASQLISDNVVEFNTIIESGKTLASGLTEAANP
jgi:hypothetical protein